jgi:DNA-binding response OmpR family regulator
MTANILIIEDNRAFADSLSSLLAAHGYPSRCTYGDENPLPIIERYHPDTVLIDIGLPGTDGWALARAICERFGERTPTLIAMTGYALEDFGSRATECGFRKLLQKPFEAAELLDLLPRAVQEA